MIAMALSCNLRLLIADEPTTATLDVFVEAQIINLFLNPQETHRTSIMMDYPRSRRKFGDMADRVIVMYAAKVF